MEKFKILNGRGSFYQWDYDQKLAVVDDTVTEVHFPLGTESCPPLPVYEYNGQRVVDVPNILLQTSGMKRVYAFVKDDPGGRTICTEVFRVNERAKPDDYIYTETELWTAEKAVQKALQEAKDSGDFDGPPGPKGDPGEPGEPGEPGKDGEDGVTPHIGENGNWYIGTTDTGISAVGKGGNGAGIDDTVVSKNSTWSSEKIASEVSNASGGTAADVTQFYRIFPAMDYKITFVKDASNNVTITLPSILFIEKATTYVTRINVDTSANTFALASSRMLCYSISGGTFGVYTEGQYAAAKTDLVPCAFNHYGRIKGQWEVYADYLSKADFRTDYNIKMCAILMGYEEEGYSVTGFQRYIDFTFDDAGNKYTMTIPKGTAFVYGNEGKKLYTVATETSINLGTVSQNDKLVWFNTSTNAFRVTASTSSPTAAEVLVCTIKTEVGARGCISVSILAPYTINGFLPGMESVYNTIDNVKYLLDFVYGDIRNATDTLHYAQIKRMAMKAPKCLPYDITVMKSDVNQYLYTYDDANGTNGKSYGIINQTGNYTIKAGTYFRLTAHLITNEAGAMGDRYNNPVFNAIRIYRTDMLKEKFDVAFTPYERYMNTNIRAISHRGLNRVAPENTLPAYIEARKAGFEYAETDVAFTSDGHAVLLHDTTVDRTSDGTGNIADLTLEQVRAMDFGSWFSPAYAGTQIPTFEEFISLCRKIGLKPYVELRDMTTEQAQSLVTIVKKYGMQKNTTWICTSTTTLSAISTAYPAARLGLVCSGLTEANVASAVALRNEVNDVFIDTDDTSDNAVALMMAADIEGEVWTVWTEAAINGLNPYFTGVTSNNLVAGSVLYKSTMGEYE